MGLSHKPSLAMSEKKVDLIIKDLTVSYHGTPVLNQANLSLPSGLLAAIIGPNGAGKSTLLKASLDLIDKQSGTVEFFGKPFGEVRKQVAYIPQKESIDWDFPATVFDVVLMGTYVHKGLFKRITKEDKKNVLKALDRVDLANFKNRQISQLSGGQQQRVFIARALVQNPDLFLMDEPFAGVDAASEHAIIQLLKSLVKEGKTILIVHHDLETVKNYFDYVILLNKTIKAHGDIQSTFTNENLKLTYGHLIPSIIS